MLQSFFLRFPHAFPDLGYVSEYRLSLGRGYEGYVINIHMEDGYQRIYDSEWKWDTEVLRRKLLLELMRGSVGDWLHDRLCNLTRDLWRNYFNIGHDGRCFHVYLEDCLDIAKQLEYLMGVKFPRSIFERRRIYLVGVNLDNTSSCKIYYHAESWSDSFIENNMSGNIGRTLLMKEYNHSWAIVREKRYAQFRTPTNIDSLMLCWYEQGIASLRWVLGSYFWSLFATYYACDVYSGATQLYLTDLNGHVSDR